MRLFQFPFYRHMMVPLLLTKNRTQKRVLMRRAEDFRLFGTRPILWAMKLIMPITFVRHAYAQMNGRTDRRHHMASIDHRPLFLSPAPVVAV